MTRQSAGGIVTSEVLDEALHPIAAKRLRVWGFVLPGPAS